MKIVENHDLISIGPFPSSDEWRMACDHVRDAVIATDWPHGSGKFTIYPQSGKKRGEGNGVDPIKTPCLQKLQALGWKTEKLPKIEKGVIETGDLDALIEAKAGYVGFEWETGNISSSHRAINKLLLTMQVGGLVGGFLEHRTTQSRSPFYDSSSKYSNRASAALITGSKKLRRTGVELVCV